MTVDSRRTIPGLSPLQIFGIASSLLAAIYLVVHIMAARPGHDQSWYLFGAARILSGVTPYGPQLAETNPPLILWLSALPVLLSRALHIDTTTALRLLVIFAIFAGALWSVRLIRRTDRASHNGFALLFGCAIVLITLCSGYNDFGQREHLFVILSLPYILAASSAACAAISTASVLSLIERIALGLAAGIAVSLKPQELVVLIALELLLAFFTRSLRRALSAEFVSLVLTCVIYLALAHVLSPLYQAQMVPLLLNTYWAFGTVPALVLALSLEKLYFAIVLLAILGFVLRGQIGTLRVVLALLVCSFAASIAYDVQHVAWFYHRLPCQMFLLLAAAWMCLELLLRFEETYFSNTRVAMPVVCVLLVLELGIVVTHLHPGAGRPDDAALDRILAQYPRSTMVYVFSTNLGSFATAYEHHLNWGSRFAHLWMVPAIVENEQPPQHPTAMFKRLPPATLAHLAQTQRSASSEDLDRWQPSVVLVRHCSPERPCMALESYNFEILPWLLESPAFAASWSHYRLQTPGPDYDIYARMR